MAPASYAREVAAFASLAATIGLAISRPRVRGRFRITPSLAAAAGVAIMLVTGVVHISDVGEAASSLWRALTTVGSIMVLTAAARRVGVLDRVASVALSKRGRSAGRHFALVFVLSALTSAVLNNDAAVLLLTPLVILHVRRVYDDPRVQMPFVFAVFMAAGVAPLVVSNPMNFIVAQFAGIGFNSYAVRMLPIAIAGWATAYIVLYAIVRRELRDARPSIASAPESRPHWSRGQVLALCVLFAVLGAYPIVSYLGQPIWTVAVGGAITALVVCSVHGGGRPLEVLGKDVSWDTLGFLVGVLVLAFGLRNVGFVDQLASVYDGASLWVIGVISAVGSAAINNHPMALINLLAIEQTAGSSTRPFLAALIGGDLGPRLLPIGSLAGLLWFAILRQHAVRVPVTRFVTVGVLVTAPSLAISLLLLNLL